MRYLISGHPRTRSAWLCALMNAHGSRCYHDAIINKVDLGIDAGIADPSLACWFPNLALAENCPRVCILRDDWREAFQEWSGIEVTDDSAAIANANCDRFSQAAGTRTIAFEALENNDEIQELVTLCTGKPASLEIIQIFQGLKIEQHLDKYRSIFAISQSA